MAQVESSDQSWVNKIKKAYSMEVIKYVSKKTGFNLVTKPDQKNKVVMRRYC